MLLFTVVIVKNLVISKRVRKFYESVNTVVSCLGGLSSNDSVWMKGFIEHMLELIKQNHSELPIESSSSEEKAVHKPDFDQVYERTTS